MSEQNKDENTKTASFCNTFFTQVMITYFSIVFADSLYRYIKIQYSLFDIEKLNLTAEDILFDHIVIFPISLLIVLAAYGLSWIIRRIDGKMDSMNTASESEQES